MPLKIAWMVSVSDHQKRQPKACSVLSEPGISKQKQDVRCQKPKILDTVPKPSPLAMDSRPPTSNISWIPDGPATKPLHVKTQMLRHQPPPRMVSKAKRFDNANAKSAVVSWRRVIGQKQSSDTQFSRWSHPAMVEVITRSGQKIVWLPVKWMPAWEPPVFHKITLICYGLDEC